MKTSLMNIWKNKNKGQDRLDMMEAVGFLILTRIYLKKSIQSLRAMK